MRKTIFFYDADKRKVKVELEINDGRFSMCGDISGHGSGQIVDSIKPKNDEQKKLIEMWKRYHLNDMKAGDPVQEAALHHSDFEVFTEQYKQIIKDAQLVKALSELSLKDYAIAKGKLKEEDIIDGKYRLPTYFKEDYEKFKREWRNKKITAPYLSRDFKEVRLTVDEIISHGDSHYSIACEYLKHKGIHVHNGYQYGTAWLTTPLPDDIEVQMQKIFSSIDLKEADERNHEPILDDVVEFLKMTETTITFKFIENDYYFPDDKKKGYLRDIYEFTIHRKGKGEYSERFGQSIAHSGRNNPNKQEPTAYSLLAGITKSDPGEFEDFCNEFGYSDDSISAHTTYEAVCKEWEGISDLYNEEELQFLMKIN